MVGNTTAWVILLVDDIQQSMVFSGAATGDPHLRSSFSFNLKIVCTGWRKTSPGGSLYK